MGDIVRTIAAGGAEKVAAAGDYVHVKTANMAFHLVFEDENYGKIEVTQGDQVRLKGDISGFRIENKDLANPLNVELIVGFGAFRAGQLVGSIDSINTIVNPVTVNAHDVNNIVNPLKPNTLVSKYYDNTASLALQTIVAPAANINGIRIDLASITIYNGDTALLAKASAPLSSTDAFAYHILYAVSGTWITTNLPNPIIIPAGLGLYVKPSNGSQNASVCYEVL